MTKPTLHFKIDPKETGKEIQKNIEQKDGLILISATKHGGATKFHSRITNKPKIINGLATMAFQSDNPAHVLMFIEDAIDVLMEAAGHIENKIERINKLN